MATTPRRAVLTGIGVLSPIGPNRAAFWDALAHGRSGVRTVTQFDPSGLPVHFAGAIPDFDPKGYLDKKERKSLRMMARTIQLAVAAAQLAMDDCGVNKAQLDPTRFGVEFGSGLIATELEEIGEAARISADGHPDYVDLEKWGAEGLPTVPPLWMLKYLPNMLACHISITHNAQGPNNTITESDVAGLLALGEAFRILRRDLGDFFLTGGAESKINPLSLVRQCLFEPLSHRNEAPEKACRPFDKQRDGLVLGEGGAVLVLEELGHAEKRGAKILAEVVGFGSAFDRRRQGGGLVRAIRAALADAGVTPQQIGHINANGLSTVESDVWEARAIHEVFGDRVPVFAPKSYFGNVGAGGAPMELAASLLAFEHGVLPPTLNYEEPDPACPVAVVAGAPRPVPGDYMLKINCTQMGQCAALVCRRWR